MPVDCATFELIDLKHSYMKLSYNEYKRALLSLLTLFSEQNKKRILLAIGVCDDMDDDAERNFRLNQTVDVALWELDEAIETGFQDWKSLNLIKRNDAFIYHELNKDECEYDCQVCKEAFRWKS